MIATYRIFKTNSSLGALHSRQSLHKYHALIKVTFVHTYFFFTPRSAQKKERRTSYTSIPQKGKRLISRQNQRLSTSNQVGQ